MSDVLITIDTEFSAGGFFTGKGSPVTDQAVYCTTGERSHGLGFMLDTFRTAGVKATFFIEAAHTAYLGHDAMRPVVDAVLKDGHDVQLHLHPMWLQAAGHIQGQPVSDSVASMNTGGLRQLFDVGLEAFRQWGAPTPVAFRAGNLQMGRHVYDVMAAYGIRVSSSVGTAIHAADDPALRFDHGCHPIGDCVEVPVLGYRAIGRPKNLTVTGSGAAETKGVLKAAQAAGIEDIVVLTHPFEFVKRFDRAFEDLSVNRVNQRRLRKLCAMLAHDDRFNARTFADKVPLWLGTTSQPNEDPLDAPPLGVVARMLENKINDAIRWF